VNANENYDATFWNGCAQGQFLLQQCDQQHLQYPPGPACRACGQAIARWVEARRSGTVEAFSLVTRAPTASFTTLLPYMVGIVRLAEGPLVETWLKLDGHTPEIADVSVGRAVVFEFQTINDKVVPVAALQ
jgi:uncharacterized OB-fold protein